MWAEFEEKSITFLMKITNCWLPLSVLLQAEHMSVWQGTRTDLNKAVRNFLARLGSAALWTNYSLKGAKGKEALDKTQVYTVIKSRSFFKNLNVQFRNI